MTTGIHEAPIYSVLGGDPDLAELVEMFVDEMPARVTMLERAFQEKEMEPLQRAAHQLKGAAGSYGFHEVTPLAAAVEEAVRRGAPEETIGPLLDELLRICSLLRAGAP